MSLVALRLQKRHCPHHILRLAFQQDHPLLPSFLPNQLVNSQGKTFTFRRRLTVTLLPQSVQF